MFEGLMNNKYIFLIFTGLLIIIWILKDKINFRKKKVIINEKKNKILEFDKNDNNFFVKSNVFNGSKEGYVFKTDNLGTGYYSDN
tara:strand:- start:342 stop:596 length:255 start_codon:yes stop_codon:yes gene_type:complete